MQVGDDPRVDELAQRLITPEEAGTMTAHGGTEAAVLLPLYGWPDEPGLIFTERRADLRRHAGEISFPGGRQDPEDADLAATALREAEEEIGLDEGFVDLIGQLPVYRTVTAYEVTPVVALIRPGFSLRLDAFEVAEAFEVPLEFLMNPAHHQRHTFAYDPAGEAAGQAEVDGGPLKGRRQFLSMPWTGPGLAVSNAEPDATLTAAAAKEFFIWGATAAMLRNLYRFLQG